MTGKGYAHHNVNLFHAGGHMSQSKFWYLYIGFICALCCFSFFRNANQGPNVSIGSNPIAMERISVMMAGNF